MSRLTGKTMNRLNGVKTPPPDGPDGGYTPLPENLRVMVADAFIIRKDFKMAEGRWNEASSNLTKVLDEHDLLDPKKPIVTTQGRVTYTEFGRHDVDVDKVKEAYRAGRVTIDDILRGLKKLDHEVFSTLLPEAITESLVQFIVLRPAA